MVKGSFRLCGFPLQTDQLSVREGGGDDDDDDDDGDDGEEEEEEEEEVAEV